MPAVFNDEKMFWIMISLLSTFFMLICGLVIYIWNDNKSEKLKDRTQMETLQKSMTEHISQFSLYVQKNDFMQKEQGETVSQVKNESSAMRRTLSFHSRQLKKHDTEINNLKNGSAKA